GGDLKKPQTQNVTSSNIDIMNPAAGLPEPTEPVINGTYNILVTGIGGTGVITVGALLGMAAHIENKGASILDQTGLAQKNGAVMSHVRIANNADELSGTRIPNRQTDLVVGCDLVVAAGQDAVQTYDLGRTRAIINDHVVPVAAFTLSPDLAMDRDILTGLVADSIGREQSEFINSTKLATALMGDSIAANLFLLGVAFQRGTIPLSLNSIEAAIELNGIAVDANKRSFAWGRKAAADQKAVEEIALPAMPKEDVALDTLDQIVAKRMERLKAYQSGRYAKRYGKLVASVLAAEEKASPGSTAISGAVARYFYKLMAYKDEYEVARLYTDGAFAAKVNDQFEGDFKVKFHLAPPIFAKRHEETGHLIKKEFGPWMMKAFGVLAKLRFLRGSALDPFGKSEERKSERALIGEYEKTMQEVCETLNAENLLLAAEIAEVPEQIRGYGHVKEQHLAVARAMREDLLSRYHHGEAQPLAAE
ncbi:MAG: DUF6537 domain-containing protein, partial [Sneathiella sp.]